MKLGVLAKEVTKDSSKMAPELLQKLENIFKGEGKIIGVQKGNNPLVRTISKEEADKVIKQLMDAGAKKAAKQPVEYPGTWYELPGGNGFGIRTRSSTASLKHGTTTSIDLHDLGLEGINKLKY